MRSRDYTTKIMIDHNEVACAINKETGEIREPRQYKNNIPAGKILQKYDEFNKVNTKALTYLQTILSNEELGIVFKMIQRCDYETNIMLPLSDESSYRTIAEEFGINKNKVQKIFTKLFNLGVYAQVRVANGIHSEYWTLNPYIAWKGTFIEPCIAAYFNKTLIAKVVI